MSGGSRKPDWKALAAEARREIARVRRQLPAHLAQEAETLTVSYERVPDREVVAEGLAPDTLALFEGESFAERGQTSFPVPPRIRLFLENLWEEAQGDLIRFREEVRTTYLHELGHYLGLDEDGLVERGLE